MAIFSRRDIQNMIKALAAHLPAGKLNKNIDRLNLNTVQSLDAEWEIAILHSLAHVGKIEHEPDLTGSTKPDVLFLGDGNANNQFLADVVCVSDEGLNTQNPTDVVASELSRIMKEVGLSANGFHIQFGHEMIGDYPDRQTRLKLPDHKEIATILNRELPPFRDGILANRSAAARLKIETSRMSIVVTYDPGSRYFGMGYASFTTPYSLSRNPLRNALERKYEQIEKAGYSGTKGMFVCDGGCAILRNFGPVPGGFTLTDIVHDFLRSRPAISFACIFLVEGGFGTPRRLAGAVASNPHATQKTSETLLETLKTMPSRMPVPVNDARNARLRLLTDAGQYGLSFIGGCRWNGRMVRISSRSLLELLAGRIDQKRFLDAHEFGTPGEHNKPNPFASAISQGRLITNVTVETVPHEDDDWLTFHFSDSDPAIAPFRKPNKP